MGHFAKSSLCPKRKLTTKKFETKAESDTKSIGRIVDKVGKVQDQGVQGIKVTLVAAEQGKEFTGVRIRPLKDTGVRRTILNLKDWRRVGTRAEIKPTALKFRQYDTQQSLPILGRAKLTLQAKVGATIDLAR